MPKEDETPGTETDEQTPEENDEKPAGDSTDDDGKPGDDGKPADEAPKLSHEDALKELTRVRGEAANYRVKLREAEAKLTDAKTPEDIEAAVKEIKAENERLARTVLVGEVSREHDLPSEQVAILEALAEAGKTKDELTAFAKTLATVAPGEPGDLSGGLDPTDSDDEPSDPAALARKYGRGRRKSA